MAVRDHINAATAMSLHTTDWRFVGSEHAMDRVFLQGSVLPLQRNEGIKQMRGHFVIFIDDDMVWPSDAVEKLVDAFFELDHSFDEPIIVGGLCFRRTPPYQPTLYMREQPTDGGYRFMEKWEDDIVEVDATGCAFLLVPKTALEAFAGTEMPPYEDRLRMPPPNFFRWEGRMGEDIRFCQDFKAKGGRIFVDTRIKIGHVSEVAITEQHYLEQIANRHPVDEERSKTLNKKWGLPTLTAKEARRKLGWDPDPNAITPDRVEDG